jgi:hypothetical protein
MNSVSFQGNITVTTWNKAVSSIKQYPTTQAQDKLMKDVAKDIGKQGEMLPLSKKNANFLYQLIEKITGRSIFNSQTEKTFFNNGDQIIFSDKNPALFDGTRVEIKFD